ncbi:hypothetical protein [Halostella pelagica]|uniref:hypothetical protein n=1 Tax=Halostella pelagica TaxID=2583824 RepID=UPI00107FEC95|nr:hypothetical protein [Halostella pelagica]
MTDDSRTCSGGTGQLDHPHADGVTRGTVLEYDGWQWGVVTEVAVDEDPAQIGFVLLDELGDAIAPVLEAASGCAEHYDAVKAYRRSEHEYWTDAEYLQAEIWEVLGPIHPQERDGNERAVNTETDRDGESA